VQITWEQIVASRPDIVVVMPCGYHLMDTVGQFREIERSFPAEWRELGAVRNGRVYAVDGSAYFSRPGPRVVDGLEILQAIVNGAAWESLPPDSVTQL